MMAENRKEVSVMVKSSLSKFTYLSIVLGLSLSLVACGQTKKNPQQCLLAGESANLVRIVLSKIIRLVRI